MSGRAERLRVGFQRYERYILLGLAAGSVVRLLAGWVL